MSGTAGPTRMSKKISGIMKHVLRKGVGPLGGGDGLGHRYRISEHLRHFIEDTLGIGKSAGAEISAGQPAFFGAEEGVAETEEPGDVFLGDGIVPHAIVH